MDDEIPVILQRQAKLQQTLGPLPVILVEKIQNWGETQTSEVLSVKPRNVKEIQKIVKAAGEHGMKIRCLGRGHSWAPIFTNDCEICMYMRDVEHEDGWKIKLNEPLGPDDKEITVSVMTGVTNGELIKFFLKHNLCWMSNATLPSVQMGGLISPACHGGGKDQKSIADNVKKVRVVDCNGVIQHYTDDDPEVMNALKCSLGLFGIMCDFTVKVKPMEIVENSSDFYTVGEVFYTKDFLKGLADANFSLEIFWFPFNSMSWFGTLVAFWEGKVTEWPHLPGHWDFKKDELWVKRINPVRVPKNPSPTPEDYLFEEVGMFVEDAYVRFMTEYLVKWPGSGYPGKSHSLVPGYLKAGHNIMKFANKVQKTEKITHAIHYDTWVDLCPTTDLEFCFDVDEDFEDVLKAVQIVIEKCYEKAINGEFPINLTMEMRWLGSSDAYLCPLRVGDKSQGGSGRTFALDVLGVKGTPKWEEFCCEVAQAWMTMELAGCQTRTRPRPRPHWCKQWSFIPGIEQYIRDTYGEDMEQFKRILERTNSKNKDMFLNDGLTRVLYPQKPPLTRKPKVVSEVSVVENGFVMVNKESLEFLEKFKPEMKHKKAWQEFCTSLAEHTLNVPNGGPRPRLESFWKFMEGGMEEGLGASEASFSLLLKHLAKTIFPSDDGDSETEDENANPNPVTKTRPKKRRGPLNRGGKCSLM